MTAEQKAAEDRREQAIVVFATSNPNKVREVQQVLAPFGITLKSLADFGARLEEPVEDGETFADNARLKARYYAKQLGCRCLAEDSGLCVPALGGAPGVYSARFANCEGSREERDEANNQKLLREAAALDEPQRVAYFESAVCVATPDGRVLAETLGRFEGVLARKPAGEGGFGYDPLLYLPEFGCTSAELSAEKKNQISHRGKALRKLGSQLAEIFR